MFFRPAKAILPSKSVPSASLALARLGEAAKRTEIAPMWALRETAFVVAASWSSAAARVTEEEMLGALCRIDRVQVRDHGNLRRAFSFWKLAYQSWFPRGASATAPWSDLEDASRVPDAGAAAAKSKTPKRGGPAFQIVEIMGDFDIEPVPVIETLLRIRQTLRCDHPVAHVRLAAPLAFQPLTGVALPALALGFEPKTHQDEAEWLETSLQKLTQAANDGYQRLEQLNFAWARWNEQMPDHRAHSALPDVLLMLARAPALTSRLVASSLNITRQAAARHLAALERAKIVREITTRKAWKIYFAEGLARPRWPGPILRQRLTIATPPDGQAQASSEGRSGRIRLPPIDLETHERAIAAALKEVDRAVAALSHEASQARASPPPSRRSATAPARRRP